MYLNTSMCDVLWRILVYWLTASEVSYFGVLPQNEEVFWCWNWLVFTGMWPLMVSLTNSAHVCKWYPRVIFQTISKSVWGSPARTLTAVYFQGENSVQGETIVQITKVKLLFMVKFGES